MIKLTESAFKQQYCFTVTIDRTVADIGCFLTTIQNEVTSFLSSILRQSGRQFKVMFDLQCTYFHPILIERKEHTHRSAIFPLLTEYDVDDAYIRTTEYLKKLETEFQTNQSQWTLISCNSLDINLYIYSPLRGSGTCTIKKKK